MKGSQYHNYPLLRKLIPMSFYGDDISAYKGSETGSVTVLGWCSDLGYQNPSITRYFPIAVYPEYAATDFTYDDIMGHVVARTRDMVDPAMLFDWSDDGYTCCHLFKETLSLLFSTMGYTTTDQICAAHCVVSRRRPMMGI